MLLLDASWLGACRRPSTPTTEEFYQVDEPARPRHLLEDGRDLLLGVLVAHVREKRGELSNVERVEPSTPHQESPAGRESTFYAMPFRRTLSECSTSRQRPENRSTRCPGRG